MKAMSTRASRIFGLIIHLKTTFFGTMMSIDTVLERSSYGMAFFMQ